MPNIDLSILNQRQTPAFFADTLANRPAPSFVGRIFISTDTLDLYRDTGTAWLLLSPSSTGTIGGSGTTNTIALFSGSSSIGNSAITQNTGTTDIFIGSFATPYDVIGYGNYYGTKFIINGGSNNQILVADGTTITAGTGISISAGQISATATGITGTGSAGQVSYWSGASAITGTNNFFWDSVNNFLGINTNTPAHPLDVHTALSTAITLNQTTFGNDNRIAFQNSGVANWRIGNYYNFGSNDFVIFDAISNAERISVKSSTGQTFIGTNTLSSGRLVVNEFNGDNHLVVLGANAPSIRVRTSGTSPVYQFGLGLSTSINNFIQGATAGDFCIFNSSSVNRPILFGIYNSATFNVEEGARLSASKNWLVGGNVDSGERLQVTGTSYFSNNVGININNPAEKLHVLTPTTYAATFNTTNIALTTTRISIGALTTSGGGTGGSAAIGCESNHSGTAQSSLIFYTNNGSVETQQMKIKPNGVINFSNMPTSSAGLVTGDIYSSAGVLMIV